MTGPNNSGVDAAERKKEAVAEIDAVIADFLAPSGPVEQGNTGGAVVATTAIVRSIDSLDPDTVRKHVDNADRASDITLKKLYAKWFIAILIGQLVLMNLVFFGVGAEKLHFADYALHLYMGGTMAEVFGIVLVITKYLFPKRPA